MVSEENKIVIARRRQYSNVRITNRETDLSLKHKLDRPAVKLLVKAVDAIADGSVCYITQEKKPGTPSCWIKDLLPRQKINWNSSRGDIQHIIRAFYEGRLHWFAWTHVGDDKFMVLKSQSSRVKARGQPGEIIRVKWGTRQILGISCKKILVKTRDGVLGVWLGAEQPEKMLLLKKGITLGKNRNDT